MSFTRVQTGTLNAGSGSIIPGTAVGAGHLLVLLSATFGFGVTSVADNNGDTWTHATSAQVNHTGLNEFTDCWYSLSVNSGTPNITISSSASFGYHILIEYSFTGGSLAFDVAATAQANSGSSSSISATVADSHSLLTSIVVTDTGTVSTAPSGWANLVAVSQSYNDGSADEVDTNSGTQGGNFTFTAGGNWLQTMAVFKDGSGSGITVGPTDALFPGDIPTINLRSFINLTE